MAVTMVVATPAFSSTASAVDTSQPAAPTQAQPVASAYGRVPDSAEIPNAAVVAEGQVKNSAGMPAAGISVALVAWPSDEFLANLKPGASFDLVPVGRANTDADGSYAVRIDRLERLDAMTSRSGTVNLELWVGGATGPKGTSFPRRLVAGPSGLDLEELQPQRDALGRAASAPAERVDLELADPAAIASSLKPARVARPRVSEYDFYACYTSTYLYNYSPVWSTVGTAFVATTGVTANFSYFSGTSNDFGVGYSYTGAYGSFNTGGTSASSASSTTSFATVGANTGRAFRTQFQYALYQLTCGYLGDPTVYTIYKTRSIGHWGGATSIYTPTPSATYCSSYSAGTGFTKNSTSATTQSTGVDMGSVIGLAFSSHSGYSSGTSVTFTFSSTRHLCGVTGGPAATPGQLVAKA